MKSLNSYVYIFLVILTGIIFLIVLIANTRNIPTKIEKELLSIAETLSLYTKKFLNDLRSEEVRQTVEKQIQKAKSLTNNNASFTPIIFINEQKITLNKFEELENIIQIEVDKNTNSDKNTTIEVFSDFNCRSCYELFKKIEEIKQNKRELFSKINYIKSNLPIIGGNQSKIYAYAFEAAKLQNKGDEYAKALYEKIHLK
ncbi:MAG: DsbA family protein [Candidatus Dojkabacteria bacterium]|nr:DsbA family protein [Candidatus Dojkabacteria bacterium]